MKNNSRLSLADFKMNKLESKQEIDKLLGGAAACCHWTGPHKTDPDGDGTYKDAALFDWESERAAIDSIDMDADMYARLSEEFAADVKADPELARSLGL